ncbi:acetyl-CoA carboxylase biotin carboxyl carrier protein subunit [Acrocarpospora corrugata]|uniref:Biotin carboxyl carrier protein of acetyl-CoA carboxylase n=1 Tax=Acrocarpospora corrugata TaxID=35763 RepID=A0A5M3W5L1_9ACTN|nr:acetyl-CoA carboxylase [Acrocarpospora corrugata]GES03540.1 acetyl-CoA carboxylase biotin carboxyl carrier protein subunit [Acrocarpospora corrugata]
MSEHVVQSPLPGIFYTKPSPDQPPFVEVGSVVTADTTVGLVEVMKQFAEVKAGVNGTVTEIHAENESIIGPGDGILTVEKG